MTMPQNLRQALNICEVWLHEIEQHPPIQTPEEAYAVLRAVLHTIRDRLPVNDAAHMSAQLPLIVRGIYYEGWNPASVPKRLSEQDFYDEVRKKLERKCAAVDERTLSEIIFDVLNHHLTPEEVVHVRQHLPKELQQRWSPVMQ